MVEETLYYYSKDGTETLGPVSKTVLSQLYRDKIIDSESFICREDESDWQPFDPGMFQFRPKLHPAPRKPGKAPSSPSSEGSRSKRRSRRRDAWYNEINLLDPRFLRMLNVICLVLTLSGALLAVHLRYVIFANALRSADNLYEVLGYFAGSAGFIFTVPYLVSLLFRHPLRRPALVVGIFCATPLVLWAEYRLFSSDAARSALFYSENPVDTSESSVPWQLLPNGYVGFTPALKNLQEIRDAAAIDSTDMDVVRRDLDVVLDALVVKLKACNTASAACVPFNPLTIGSLDDINNRLVLLSALRDTQADLDNFLQATVASCRDAIAKDDFSSNTVDEAISGFRKSARTDQLSGVAVITMKISDDEIACLKILAQNWGRWHVDNRAISLDDPEVLATYNALLQTVQSDTQALHDLEKQ